MQKSCVYSEIFPCFIRPALPQGSAGFRSAWVGKGSRQNIHLHFWCACDVVVWWCYWVRRSKLLAHKLITHLGSGDNIVTNITTSRLRSYRGNIMSWFVLQNQIAVGISLCKVRIILKPFKGRFLTIQIWNFGLGFLVWHNVNMYL